MKINCGFLIFDDVEDMDLVGPWEIFGIWSKYYNGPQTFTVSATTNEVKTFYGLTLQPHFDYAHCPQLDYLVVPGGQGTRKEVNNERLISFIKNQAPRCQQILSVCTGAFLLQAADLLQHKEATTHWASIDRLRQFPDVKVMRQRYTRDGNIWTSAGISAGVDLALAFIAEIAGPEVAGKVQLYAEYFPETKIYSQPDQLPPYIK